MLIPVCADSFCRGVVKVGAVDCEAEQSLCADHGVESFPTVKLIIAGGRGEMEYTEAKTARALHDFAVENLPTEVVNLRTKPHLEDFLSGPCKEASSGCCAVLLTDKYETSPVYKSLSVQHKGVVALGEARASNKIIAKEMGVDDFPSLVMVCNGEPSVYDGELKAAPLTEFIGKHAKKKR